MPRVFLITGCSTGFGANFAQEVLHNGDILVATARKSSKLSFKNTSKENYLAHDLDVTSQESVVAAFDAAYKAFNRVDVVVNNAGYGLAGVFEELNEDQIHKQMDVNYFGVLTVTREALKRMREQKPCGGLIQMVTSIGGQCGVPLFTVYCSSKFAIEGFTEALQLEMKPEWKIKFQIVEPGGFRTDWAGRSMQFPDKSLPEYDHMVAKDKMEKINGTQSGDPEKGAKAMYKLATMDNPPLRAVIGSDAHKKIMKKIDDYGDNYKKYADLANSTDVDEK